MDSNRIATLSPPGTRFAQRGRTAFAHGVRLNLHDPAQVAHYCRELGVTWLQLFALADRVGSNVGAIRSALRQERALQRH
jgi:hypothetical protein